MINVVYVVYLKKKKIQMFKTKKLSFSVSCFVWWVQWRKSTFYCKNKSRVMKMIKITFLYIWDFCKFLFESNATQTTKINLIKYTVVIFLGSSLFICSFIYSYCGVRVLWGFLHDHINVMISVIIVVVLLLIFNSLFTWNILLKRSGSVRIFCWMTWFCSY